MSTLILSGLAQHETIVLHVSRPARATRSPLRAAGVPTYGVSGMFGDTEDIRAHGRDERIGVVGIYDGVELSHRFLRALTGATPAGATAGRRRVTGPRSIAIQWQRKVIAQARLPV